MIAARLSPGAISLKPLTSQRRFQDGEAGGVPAWAVEPPDEATGDGVAHVHKDDRDRARLSLEGNGRGGRIHQNDVRLQVDQLFRDRSYSIGVNTDPPKVHPHVAAIGPTQVCKCLRERREAKLRQRIVFVGRHERADAPHPLALLRPRREGPSCPAEPCNELPPSHLQSSRFKISA
jgi:hypothetical protein